MGFTNLRIVINARKHEACMGVSKKKYGKRRRVFLFFFHPLEDFSIKFKCHQEHGTWDKQDSIVNETVQEVLRIL